MSLYIKLCNKKLLVKVWRSIYNGKTVLKRNSSRGIDGITLDLFKENERQYLREILDSLKTKSYLFSPTKISAIQKDDGTARMIAIQVIKDRIVQKAILSIINEILYPYISNGMNFSGIRKDYWNKKEKAPNRMDAIKKVIEHVKQKKFWIFESDIDSFFDKIPKNKMLQKLFKILSPDTSINKILKSIVNFEIANPDIYKKYNKEFPDLNLGVPQGSSLSPILANLYLFEFDSYMFRRFGERFIRYADDFLVMCDSEFITQKAKKMAKYKIKREGLSLKKGKKTRVIHIKKEPLIFLGVKFDRNRITPKRTYSEIIKNWDVETLNWKKYKEVCRAGKTISTIEQMNEKILGWAYGYRYLHTENTFKLLDEYLDKKEKDAKGRLKGLQRINKKITLDPLITINDWQLLFKKTK